VRRSRLRSQPDLLLLLAVALLREETVPRVVEGPPERGKEIVVAPGCPSR
jgi:hypothetical protein